jgi:hypothetical protein
MPFHAIVLVLVGGAYAEFNDVGESVNPVGAMDRREKQEETHDVNGKCYYRGISK